MFFIIYLLNTDHGGLQVISPSAVSESLSLSNTSDLDIPLYHHCRFMGVNEKVVPRIDLATELVPQPYVASRQDTLIQSNFKCSLSLLGVPNASRGFILICDETAWFSTLDLISLGYIGGYHARDPDHDFSFLDMEQMKDCSDDKLSKLTQHYVVVRSDTTSHCYCIDMLPRPPKSAGLIANGAAHTFREFGQCLHNATVANCGQPPIGVAFDGGTAHTLLNRALLGLVFLVVSFNGSMILQFPYGHL